MNEKRRPSIGIDGPSQVAGDLFERVGGRQEMPAEASGGGGYQNICTVLNFDPRAAEKKRDPRLEELREMGLQRIWLDIAEKIGVDAFLSMWRILDSDQTSIENSGRLMVPIRAYGTYLRYQRNRYVEALSEMGYSPPEIRQKLKEQLCEHISIRHISRLVQPE
jgi:hypothetical protein